MSTAVDQPAPCKFRGEDAGDDHGHQRGQQRPGTARTPNTRANGAMNDAADGKNATETVVPKNSRPRKLRSTARHVSSLLDLASSVSSETAKSPVWQIESVALGKGVLLSRRLTDKL
jgi:hypothetical protein